MLKNTPIKALSNFSIFSLQLYTTSNSNNKNQKMHRGFVGSYAFSAVHQEDHPEQAVWQQFDSWMTLKTVNLVVVFERQ